MGNPCESDGARFRRCRYLLFLAALLGLSGCASPALFAATEIAPRAINGKGLAEDGADIVTGKDCRLVEGTLHKNRKICETRNSPQTRHDFKGFVKASPDR